MPAWAVWVIVAVLLAAGEVATVGFVLGPIALAAVLAGLVAVIGAGVVIQLLVFILVALASVAALRPIARGHLRTPAQLRTGTAALVGSRALVLEPGTTAEVAKIEGATALVYE